MGATCSPAAGEGRRSLVERLREQREIAETVDMDLTVLEQGSLEAWKYCAEQQLHVKSAVHEQLHSWTPIRGGLGPREH